MNVAGLLLAAGAGTRFGRPKAEIELNGERLVDIGVRTLADGGCFPVVVVAGAAELTVPDVTLVSNPGWATGMGSSLRAGLAALDDLDVNAVVVLLVDTPWVSSEAVRRVAGNASAAAVATYGGHRGHPVRLSRTVWDEVACLAEGNIGAKAWLRAHPDQVVEVDCTGSGDSRDIDHPEDLARA